MIIHQFLPTFERGAVGNHSLLARDVLRAAGHTSEIYAAEVKGDLGEERPFLLRDYRGGADVLVYQMAIGSVTADLVLARREPLVVNYHNQTPVKFLAGWEPVSSYGVAWGQQQLHDLATRSSLGIAVSHYNEEDLVEAGFPKTVVVPFLIDMTSLDVEPDPSIEKRDATTWLFVGRFAPNKCQHDVIKAFAAYRRFHDADARLVLIGGGMDGRYAHALVRVVDQLGLEDAVHFPGSVSPEQLAAYYRTSDALVVMSEHEGFCVPLVEAMHHRLPVIAYAEAAVPETVGEAGLVLSTKDPVTVAAAAARVATDDALRAELIERGVRRAQAFDITRTGPAFVDAVASVAR